MAAYDEESRIDEMERDTLQKVISDVETALAVSTPSTRGVLDRVLENARARVGELEKKIKDAKIERETKAINEAALAQMAAREAKLSTEEKETFSGFLAREFFTKKDFGALEQFYTKTWDRLSDDGKTAMSVRVWEGIRKEEYTFTELPKTVREKEMDRAYKRLHESEIGSADESRIPVKDREDFFRAYEAGEREKAGKVLERESFKGNMFRHSESKGVKQAKLEAVRDAEAVELGKNVATGPAITTPSLEKREAGSAKDLSAFGLDGVKLVEVEEQGSSQEIPNAKGGKGNGGPSLPG